MGDRQLSPVRIVVPQASAVAAALAEERTRHDALKVQHDALLNHVDNTKRAFAMREATLVDEVRLLRQQLRQ
jgi:hypothetical protein